MFLTSESARIVHKNKKYEKYMRTENNESPLTLNLIMDDGVTVSQVVEALKGANLKVRLDEGKKITISP